MIAFIYTSVPCGLDRESATTENERNDVVESYTLVPFTKETQPKGRPVVLYCENNDLKENTTRLGLFEPNGLWSRRLSPVSVVLSRYESLTPPGQDINPSQVSSLQTLVLIYLPRKLSAGTQPDAFQRVVIVFNIVLCRRCLPSSLRKVPNVIVGVL